jgi:arylsulfatase A-like enzyme
MLILKGMLLGAAAAALIAAAPALKAKAATTSGPPATKNRPPNIVYIISDDQGWKDVGYHGSDIKTPNIDALAAGGARLEQFYAQPMCTPTRAALMTGRYPFRYGLQTAVIPSSHTWGLPTDEWLLPQALKDAGYETAIAQDPVRDNQSRRRQPGQGRDTPKARE